LINNRQAGRRRGRGGNNNGQQRQGNPGRPDNGNRIDSRARGNASQLLEKYKNMAADAQRSGDRVTTEYYLQFADHYFRVLSEQRGRFEEQQPRRSRDDFDFDGPEELGEDFGDEGEPVRGNEQDTRVEMRDRDDRPERQREDRGNERPRSDRDDRPRGDREERPRAERAEREDRPRGERDGYRRDGAGEARNGRDAGEGRSRDGAGEGRSRDVAAEGRSRDAGEGRSRDAVGEGRGRDRGDWQDRPRRSEPPAEVAAQRRADPIQPTESLEARAEEVLEADRPLDPPARRRGRPRRDAAPAAENDAFDSGFEADRLPPSLTLAANDEAPAEAKPRRRRVRPAEDTSTAAE
jgi:hypothetical protein